MTSQDPASREGDAGLDRGPTRKGRLGFAVTACLASAALAAPIAIGATGAQLAQGVRNPATGSAARETLVIASTAQNVFGTRQSNVGAGGAAIYGCRTTADLSNLADPSKSTPCLRVNNLSGGLIFNFRFARGSVGGVYQAGPTSVNDLEARPFITNATGVATGLNADRVDSTRADDLIAAIRATGAGPQGPKGPAGDPGASGPAGPAGIPGARGQWFTGVNAPPDNLVGSQPGDFYLDLGEAGRGNVYQKSSFGTWGPPQQNIRGPQGPTQVSASVQAYINQVVGSYCSQGHCG